MAYSYNRQAGWTPDKIEDKRAQKLARASIKALRDEVKALDGLEKAHEAYENALYETRETTKPFAAALDQMEYDYFNNMGREARMRLTGFRGSPDDVERAWGVMQGAVDETRTETLKVALAIEGAL